MATRSIGRTLVLVFLALAMGGFGICALCGGVMWVSELGNPRSGDLVTTILVLTLIGAGLAVLCGWAMRKLMKRPTPPAE